MLTIFSSNDVFDKKCAELFKLLDETQSNLGLSLTHWKPNYILFLLEL